MTFRAELLKRLNEARPHNKEATHKLYVTCIRKIYEKNKKPFEDIELVKDKGVVLAVVSQFATSTMRNYFTACANVLRLEEPTDEVTNTIKFYEDSVRKYNNKYNKEQESGIISEKQEEQFSIGIEGVIDMLLKMEHNLENDRTYLCWLVFQILLRHPLRNEVVTLKKISYAQFAKLKLAGGPNEDNYLVIPANIYKKPLKIVSTNYKTSGTYGIKTIDIEDKQLRKMIMNYIKHTGNIKNGEALFRLDEKDVDEKTLTNLLLYHTKAFTPNGVSISTTIFTKIVLSHKFADVSFEMKKAAIDRGHSISTQGKTYIKQLKPMNLEKPE